MRDPVFQKFKFAAIKSLHDHWLSFFNELKRTLYRTFSFAEE